MERFTLIYKNGRVRSLMGYSKEYILENYVSNKDIVHFIENENLSKEYKGCVEI